MTLAYWCVLIAICLPYLATGYAKFSGGDFGPKQNSDPRAFLATLEGARKRAASAQLNGFEVTPAFAAAVIIAHLAGGAEQSTLNALAVAFVNLGRWQLDRLEQRRERNSAAAFVV